VFQDSFAPLHACLLFSTLDMAAKAAALPVYVLDDAEALAGAAWTVVVRAYDAGLKEIRRAAYTGQGLPGRVVRVGTFDLEPAQTESCPLLFVSEISKDGTLVHRTFYWANFEARPGCLFELPRTRLSLKVEGGRARVCNEGAAPAVGVEISRPGHADTFKAEDGFFWLDPGETRAVAVSATEGLCVSALNAANAP